MIDHELSLLEQIRANPHDKQLRRVYGDMLLERGDDRGEYTQIALQETWGDAKDKAGDLWEKAKDAVDGDDEPSEARR